MSKDGVPVSMRHSKEIERCHVLCHDWCAAIAARLQQPAHKIYESTSGQVRGELCALHPVWGLSGHRLHVNFDIHMQLHGYANL
jgi:hypothetical protein